MLEQEEIYNVILKQNKKKALKIRVLNYNRSKKKTKIKLYNFKNKISLLEIKKK